MADAWELTDEIFATQPLERLRDRLLWLMIETARALPALPLVAARGLDVAEAYWRGGRSAEELVRARVACWEFLGPLERAHKSDPRSEATRAALCSMHAEWATVDEGDLFLRFWFFLDMVARDDAQHATLVARLERLFDPT